MVRLGDFHADGSLAVAYDSNEDIADPAGGRDDTFNHVLAHLGAQPPPRRRVVNGREVLGPNAPGRSAGEQIDISVTHWAGQYVPRAAMAHLCGPDGYSDPPITNAEGKDCNVFDGDYTGLAVGSTTESTWCGPD